MNRIECRNEWNCETTQRAPVAPCEQRECTLVHIDIAPCSIHDSDSNRTHSDDSNIITCEDISLGLAVLGQSKGGFAGILSPNIQ